MKKFILKCCCFLLPFLIFGTYLEYGLSKYPNSYLVKKDDISQNLQNIEVLILGTSHALNGLNPRFFSQKTFNLANASQSIYYDKALLDLYIDKLPKLKTVILSVSYFSFWYQLESSPEDWRKYFYYQYLNIPNQSINNLEFKAWSSIVLYSPKKTLDIALQNFKVEENKLYYQGWNGTDTAIAEISMSDTKKRIDFHHVLMAEKNIVQNIQYINEIITKLRKKNIDIIIIRMPVYKTYYKQMLPKYSHINDSIIKTLTSQYKVFYYNYSQNHHFNRTDFHDSDHLSFIGAEKFSKVVDSLIIQQK
jgi:hypothetical protein